MLRQTIQVILVLSSFLCLAQHQVSGTIVDELGLPVIKAKITLDDSSTAIFTDYKGVFLISSETDFYWKINISCEGFLTETYYVLDGGNAGNIMLAYDIDMKKLMFDDNGFIHKVNSNYGQSQLAFVDTKRKKTYFTSRFLK